MPWFSFGALDDDGNIVRDPTFPDMPSFKEVCEATDGCETSGEKWEAWKAFFIAGFPAQKMVFLPKDTSQDIVDAYQAAITAMKADPDYTANKEAVLGTYEQVVGKAADALFKKGTVISPELRKQVVDMLSADYGVKLGEE